MKLNKEQIAQVKACQGVYRQADVARYYGVSPMSVRRMWGGAYPTVVPSQAPYIPNATCSDYQGARMDVEILYERGLSVAEIAHTLRLTKATVLRHLGVFVNV